MRVGVRYSQLGTPELTWADMWALARYADHTTAIYRSVNGHAWSVETALLAEARDIALFDFYQYNRAHGGRMQKPDMYERPGALAAGTKNETKGQSADLADIKKFLERKNGR
jgi:hypothetical protein